MKVRRRRATAIRHGSVGREPGTDDTARLPAPGFAMPAVVLATINARYIHCALGLRYLAANLGDIEHRVVEYTVQQAAVDIVADLLSDGPQVVGLGVYIWNVRLTLDVVTTLRAVAPDVVVVLGGPEVSHEPADPLEWQEVVQRAHYTVRGEGEVAFRRLCEAILAGRPPPQRIVDGGLPELSALSLPYALYSDADLANRVLYVEASRGCPFRCEFCLSALDTGVRSFDLDALFASLQHLLDRGATRFKFVDRTFNLKVSTSTRILQFFLDRYRPGLFLHFELVPDRLPSPLRTLLAAFPAGVVQLEVGLQTLDTETGSRIARRQDLLRAQENFAFLRQQTGVHVHADLIAGLPGEDLPTFARGFDTLLSWGPHEIQLGILKRLRGAPIRRHDAIMTWSEAPPYEVLATDAMDFSTLLHLRAVAKAWDIVANSGNFVESAPLIWEGEPSPFFAFSSFTSFLMEGLGRTHSVALLRLVWVVFDYLVDVRNLDPERVRAALERDYTRTGRGKVPRRLQRTETLSSQGLGPATTKRQKRHHSAEQR